MLTPRTLAALCLLSGPSLAFADNVLHSSTPVLDRPTVMSLGMQLPFTGDDNRNASVSVRYRPASASTWQPALNMYRVRPDTIFAYNVTQQFAGSIFDLKPNTTYMIELHAVDPDGTDQTFPLTATTRAVPADPVTPRAVAVASASQLQSALANANSGDIITLAPGTYAGQFGISRSGTAANPIVIRGSSQAGVILDGQNCSGCNILEVYGSYTHVENLTLRNGERAIRFQTAGSRNNVVRRVYIKNTIWGITGRANQLDFYIADNILEGRLAWPHIYTDDGGAHSDDDGIAVSGFGMVVAHNRISGYGDAIKTTQYGARSLDVYGNDVLWSYDNGLELDQAEGNARALRNRFTNCSTPISVQPVYAGPAYIIRNIASNTVDEQIKFHALNIASPPPQPNGVLVYNNTFLSSETELQVQTPFGSYHAVLENNLFLGPSPLPGYAVNWDAPINFGLFDYNGYYPDGQFLFRWSTGYGHYPNFAALKAAGVEPHGLLLTSQTFANGLQAPTNYRNLMSPPDATLSASGAAVNRAFVLANVNDAFTGAAPDLGALELGCPMPIYGPRPAGTDESNEPLGCSGGAPPPPPPPSGTAVFLRSDSTTQGNWKTAYGADGAIVTGDSSVVPSYVTVTPAANNNFTWQSSTSDVRALLKRSSTTDRVAACWYSAGAFTVALNFTDGQPHQVAIYALDWDGYGGGRTEKIEILDSAGAVLDTRSLSSFQGGQYLVWTMSGSVTIRVTNTNSASNAVLLGLFFGASSAPPPSSGTAAFVKLDTTTQGNWKTAYGSDGAIVVGDSSVLPSYVTVTPSTNNNFVWQSSTSDPRALLKRASTTDRVAACWYSYTAFTVGLNFTDGQPHQVALYALDWDGFGGGRVEKIEVLNSAGTVLDTRSLSGFQGGQYLVWTLGGNVTLRITSTNSSSNAVLFGLFFGPGASPPPSSGSAAFVRNDSTTKGNWKTAYGSDGAIVVGDSSVLPSYVTVTPAANNSFVWQSSSSDVRALLKRASTDRVVACWYNAGAFTIGLNFTDGQPHQVALYALDWDSFGGGRAQKIEMLNSAGAVLDTRTLADFEGGQYLVWNMSGNVTVRITNTNPSSNAVFFGLFFGGGSAPPPSGTTAAFVKLDTTTRGNWKSVYGAAGSLVVGDGSSLPSYVTVTPAANSTFVWAPTTSESRALLKHAAGADRVAACWYNFNPFTVTLNFTDGQAHQVALYAVDWDSYAGARGERIDVLDAGGTVLDTRALSNFQTGQYLVWNMSGSVTLRFTSTNPFSNSVMGGLFFQ